MPEQTSEQKYLGTVGPNRRTKPPARSSKTKPPAEQIYGLQKDLIHNARQQICSQNLLRHSAHATRPTIAPDQSAHAGNGAWAQIPSPGSAPGPELRAQARSPGKAHRPGPDSVLGLATRTRCPRPDTAQAPGPKPGAKTQARRQVQGPEPEPGTGRAIQARA